MFGRKLGSSLETTSRRSKGKAGCYIFSFYCCSSGASFFGMVQEPHWCGEDIAVEGRLVGRGACCLTISSFM